jgi:hypothetical protein
MQRPQYTHATTEPALQEVFSKWLRICPLQATNVFSVLWSGPRLYNEKPTITGSSVQLEVLTVPVECPVEEDDSVQSDSDL